MGSFAKTRMASNSAQLSVLFIQNLNFDGVATACVFAWEERAHESSAFMLDRITKELTV